MISGIFFLYKFLVRYPGKCCFGAYNASGKKSNVSSLITGKAFFVRTASCSNTILSSGFGLTGDKSGSNGAERNEGDGCGKISVLCRHELDDEKTINR